MPDHRVAGDRLGHEHGPLARGGLEQALDAAVLVGVGAAFDFHVGRVAQAPRWLMAVGLEWLFRLFQEPRRLWRRYLLYNPLFVALLALELAGLGSQEVPETDEMARPSDGSTA